MAISTDFYPNSGHITTKKPSRYGQKKALDVHDRNIENRKLARGKTGAHYTRVLVCIIRLPRSSRTRSGNDYFAPFSAVTAAPYHADIRQWARHGTARHGRRILRFEHSVFVEYPSAVPPLRVRTRRRLLFIKIGTYSFSWNSDFLLFYDGRCDVVS